MSDLKAFLKQNVETKENIEVIVSNRFKDEKGNAVPFTIRQVTAKEDEAIRIACTKKVQVPGKKGQYVQDFDSQKYISRLAAASIVEPNLQNAELQDSYDVTDPVELLLTMLTSAEFNTLVAKITENNGINISEVTDEDIEEAKN